MFGLEVLDILIGLFFVYLVLSLLCTAINEYIATLTNKRGRELKRGIEQLLDDTGAGPALKTAVLKHPLIETLRQKRDGSVREPSYIPARRFAMALLDAAGTAPDKNGNVQTGQAPAQKTVDYVLKVLQRDSTGDLMQFITDPKTYNQTGLPPDAQARLSQALLGAQTEYQKLQDSVEVWFNNSMDRVSGAYKRYTQWMLLLIGLGVAIATNADTIQIWRTLSADDALAERFADQAAASMPRMAEWVVRDSLENERAAADSANPVTTTPTPDSEASKADTQTASGASFGNGAQRPVILSAAFTAQDGEQTNTQTDTAPGTPIDTTQQPAGTPGGQTETGATETPADTTPVRVDSLTAAKALYDSTTALLKEMELKLGWTMDEWNRTTSGFWPFISKIVGLLLTAIALSMGAPFWFDTLNKFINIRGAGRAPDEKAKAPEAPGKRLAEQPTR